MVPGLRLIVVAIVLVLLARAATFAWRNRRLATVVWRRIRPRHVLGSLGLLAVVLATAAAMFEFVPLSRLGVGSLLGLSGNAVFAPLEEIAARGGDGLLATPDGTGPGGGSAPARPGVLAMVSIMGFLAGLLALIPWLAYVEERAFREGLERAGPAREVLAALKFGLLHLVMLIPLAAALAIGVAGYAYGRVYRRAYRQAAAASAPVAGPAPPAGAPPAPVPPAPVPPVAHWRHAAVLESTTWHVAFNSLIVLLVVLGLGTQWLLAG